MDPGSRAPAVVITTHLGGALLAACVEALAAQTLAPSRVVVVVSALGPVRVPAGIETIFLGANPGFCAAANAGLRAVAGQAALLLNDDTQPRPDCIQMLYTTATAPGIYQPTLLLAADPSRLDNAGHGLLPDGFNLPRGRGRPPPAWQPATVAGFSGAAVLFTAGLLDEIGYFDESFHAFGEDLDLSLRAARAGYAVRLVPEATVTHQLGASYGRASPGKVYLVERNRVRAALRSMPISALLSSPLSAGARLGVQGLGSALGRGAGAGLGLGGVAGAVLGGLSGLAHAPDALRKRRADQAGWRLGELDMLRWLVRHRAPLADLLPPELPR